MDRYKDANLAHWNEVVPIHERSEFYDVAGFKAGRSSLNALVRDEVGDVTGKRLLHLQCHFGLDTLSWARLGARATGVDFSESAINLARRLSKETDVPARFVHANVYDLPNVLGGKFDIVFTSYGVLCWLPDLAGWGRVVAHFLKRGGTFYLMDFHPFTDVFYMENDATELKPLYSYFHRPEPMVWEPDGSYADKSAKLVNKTYEWTHPLSDVMAALLNAGLRIEQFHEFPFCGYQRFPFLEQDEGGWWRMPKGMPAIPLMFSVRATK